MTDIEPEFFLDVGARQRLLRTTAKMRLSFLDDGGVIKYGANMPGEIIRIGIARVDDVSNLCRKREHLGIPHRLFTEGVEADIATNEAGRENIWSGEFGRIAIGRSLFVGERLPQAMHRPFRDLAEQFLDRGWLDTARRETPGAIDIWMRHGTARI